jgi:glycosyltransferase involved in cell wall biosynthesis
LQLLVLTELWPHPAHSTRAANVVLFELLRALAALPGIRVSCLRVFRGKETPPDAAEQHGIALLRDAGITLCPPLVLPPPPRRRSVVARLLAPNERDQLPEAIYRPLLEQAVTQAGADAIFIPWSEFLTALAAPLPQKKFAYYGNPLPKNRIAARDFARRHGGTDLTMLRQQIYDRRLESIHLDQMARYDWLGDVAANDAEYYVEHGHRNAFYIRNIWIERDGIRAEPSPIRGKAVIIGNVGRLSATANSHGLEILGRDFVPALRKLLPSGSFEIHLIGAGEPHPAIRGLLAQPEIKIRGFVDDIDREIAEAALFLCLNNASIYKVGHTRYLHAFSLAAPVLAHADAALSMPEIRHGENALLGGSIAEVAALAAEAIGDASLRRHIGDAGYETFKDVFTADKVAPTIGEHLLRAA